MIRSVLVVAALCSVGCRNDAKSSRAEPVKIEMPKIDVAAALRGADAGAAADAAPTATGAFDFEIVRRAGAYVLRDAAYEVTFPLEPKTEVRTAPTSEGKPLQFMTAIVAAADMFYSLSVTPMPSNSMYNKEKGLDGSRDGMLKMSGAKLISESPGKVAGLDGRHLVVAIPDGAKTLYLNVHMVWDAKHRALVSVAAGNHERELQPAGRTFLESFVIHDVARSPLDPPEPQDGVATPTTALDLELVHQGDRYVVRDEALEIGFPARPNVTGDVTGAMPYAEASMYGGEAEYFGLIIMTVPEHTPYDGVKGLKGALDGMLKAAFTDHPHVKDTKGKVGGLDGHWVQASGTTQGRRSVFDGRLVWDAKHRALIAAITTTTGTEMTAAGRAFLDSLVIHAKGKAPHVPASK